MIKLIGAVRNHSRVRVRARAKARAITGEEVMVKQRAFTMFSLRIRVEML
jgi:hypothetical protein